MCERERVCVCVRESGSPFDMIEYVPKRECGCVCMKERGRCSGCVIPRYLGIESEQEWIRRQQRTQIDELN